MLRIGHVTALLLGLSHLIAVQEASLASDGELLGFSNHAVHFGGGTDTRPPLLVTAAEIYSSSVMMQ